ncbi:unnamed protein product [Effrenium voratum]|nr:unnamed protein product [Effrenium voratum]CAJ1454099.1 unnamed protein product [Effrenium voratum]|eukprot:CAMPEP_0181475376 /NCGR_PEP_ID=MMETSP1110-20121109/41153_1 /TAXON_ID=174948 /ORGANISM="Symbiodinium sp., Strain CCMP421" /LENGTH=295 /DNA_ID=CAMNT_0023600613 /DNA_START=93 /DNA_END=980 /DNA_ORIENTATION=+
MGKKSKEPKPLIDNVLIWLAVLSGVIGLVCLIPKVPYRYAEVFTGYHSRFAVARRYSLFGPTNRNGQVVSWYKMKRDVCLKLKEFQQGNPMLTAAVGIASTQSGVGGAAAGCLFWDACKIQMQVRCNEYATMSIISILVQLLQLIGVGALLCVPMMLNGEDEAAKEKKGSKKEKAKKNAMAATMNCSVAGFACTFLSWALYMGCTANMFATFKVQEAYAYGYAYFGSYVAVTGYFFALICALLAWRRWNQFGKEKDEEEDTSKNADMPTDPMASMPPGAPGAPPGMPGLGGPPPT